MTTFAATTNADAFSILRSQASASGVSLGVLSDVAAVALTVANILSGGASAESLPAGNITHGTFGSVTSDVGDYTFPGNVNIVDTATLLLRSGTVLVIQNTDTTSTVRLRIGATDRVQANNTGVALVGAVTETGTITAAAGVARGYALTPTLVAAVNADALTGVYVAPSFTPGAFTALVARGINVPAFSVATFTSPADPVGVDLGIITGTGATNAFGVRIAPPTGATNNYLIAHTTAATFNVKDTGAITAAGLLTIAGVTSSAALTVNAASQLGTAAGTDQTVIGGTGYGAGVASLRFNGLTTAATNNLVGTLTNSPVTGNPTFWMPISIAGTIKYIPCF